MNIYIICSVRGADAAAVNEIREYAQRERAKGIAVHFPPDDAPQDDPTGAEICKVHLEAMKRADEVRVFWDVRSLGSHFDLGMAYALGKPIIPVSCVLPDPEGKSYWKAVIR